MTTHDPKAGNAASLAAFDPAESFARHLEIAVREEKEKTSYPTSEWGAAGRRTKDKPNGEDLDWWAAAGGGMVADWVTLRQASDWVTWDIDGEPALELQVSANVGPFLVRGAIDWVAVAGGELIIVDKKTGSRTPDSDLQLGIYRILLKKIFGVDIRWGCYWMSRKGMTAPVDLEWCSLEWLTNQLEMFKRALDAQVFLAHITSHCKTCGVRDFCKAVDGPRAHEAE